MSTDDVIVVIRTAGERTFAACRALLASQVSDSRIEIAAERPFERTLRRSYEIGIQRNAKWTMTLDADVLLRDGAVSALLAQAEKLPHHFIQIEGLVHDKLTGRFRKAGHRIYRTQHLAAALEEIPSIAETIRPEFETLRRMKRRGYPSREINMVVGIHDYEQHFCDVYRKGFVHANKHQVWLADMVARWKALAKEDDDFRVALRGLYDGLLFSGIASIDSGEHSDSAKAALQDLDVREKSAAAAETLTFEYVTKILESAGEPPGVSRHLMVALWRNLNRLRSRLGTLRILPYMAGAGFCRIGDFLKSIASK